MMLKDAVPDDVFLHLQRAASESHVSLLDVLNAGAGERPRRAPHSSDELTRGFEVFVPALGLPAAPAAPATLASAPLLTVQQQATPAAAHAYSGGASSSAGAPSYMPVPAVMIASPVAPVAHAGAVSSFATPARSATAGAGSSASAPQAGDDPRLALMPLDAHMLKELSKSVLQPALDRLKALRWEDWPAGNPFIFKFTKANAAAAGVPMYFSIIREPMDLTRIDEKVKKFKYASVDAFLADCALIASNAKTFNAPPSVRGTNTFPHPSFLSPDELVSPCVYAMAFDLEAVVESLAPALRRDWQALERAMKQRALAAIGGAR